jgi:hypothetical protein
MKRLIAFWKALTGGYDCQVCGRSGCKPVDYTDGSTHWSCYNGCRYWEYDDGTIERMLDGL